MLRKRLFYLIDFAAQVKPVVRQSPEAPSSFKGNTFVVAIQLLKIYFCPVYFQIHL